VLGDYRFLIFTFVQQIQTLKAGHLVPVQQLFGQFNWT